MTAPAFIRRWRARIDEAQTNRLRAQLSTAKDRNKALERRVADLQVANEGAYHELSIERGQACLKTDCSRCKAVETRAAT
ncbi:hypothetical protein ACFWR9_11280 [Streptomyces sp. NPDC058534]|uniref:hypothetical protein n=1 Tax=Streptomyces sp. NPDC058534 TaxID=3346541 RepID=UPI00365F517C